MSRDRTQRWASHVGQNPGSQGQGDTLERPRFLKTTIIQVMVLVRAQAEQHDHAPRLGCQLL
jgi:hypothetical protein